MVIFTAILGGLFLMLPLLVIVPMSFGTDISFRFPPAHYGLTFYSAYFSSSEWLSATVNSILIGLACMVLTMVITVPAAMGHVRYRFRGRGVANILLMSPLIVPQVVTALACYNYFSAIGLAGSLIGLIIAHTVLAVPIAFLVISATLKGFDRNLERAAMSSGAGPLRTFALVTLPVLRPGMLTAGLFAFLTSFNEAVVAIFIAGRDSTTLPKKMYDSIRVESDPVIAVVSSLLIGLVVVGVLTYLITKRRTTA